MKAKIYRPAKNPMQSGRGGRDQWVLEYDAKTQRGPDSLMGWNSADNTLGQVKLRFSSLKEAQAYAGREGLEAELLADHTRRVKPRNYGDNFRYIPAEEA